VLVEVEAVGADIDGAMIGASKLDFGARRLPEPDFAFVSAWF
jgi:hypothetical protein